MQLNESLRFGRGLLAALSKETHSHGVRDEQRGQAQPTVGPAPTLLETKRKAVTALDSAVGAMVSSIAANQDVEALARKYGMQEALRMGEGRKLGEAVMDVRSALNRLAVAARDAGHEEIARRAVDAQRLTPFRQPFRRELTGIAMNVRSWPEKEIGKETHSHGVRDEQGGAASGVTQLGLLGQGNKLAASMSDVDMGPEDMRAAWGKAKAAFGMAAAAVKTAIAAAPAQGVGQDRVGAAKRWLAAAHDRVRTVDEQTLAPGEEETALQVRGAFQELAQAVAAVKTFTKETHSHGVRDEMRGSSGASTDVSSAGTAMRDAAKAFDRADTAGPSRTMRVDEVQYGMGKIEEAVELLSEAAKAAKAEGQGEAAAKMDALAGRATKLMTAASQSPDWAASDAREIATELGRIRFKSMDTQKETHSHGVRDEGRGVEGVLGVTPGQEKRLPARNDDEIVSQLTDAAKKLTAAGYKLTETNMSEGESYASAVREKPDKSLSIAEDWKHPKTGESVTIFGQRYDSARDSGGKPVKLHTVREVVVHAWKSQGTTPEPKTTKPSAPRVEDWPFIPD